MTLLEARAAGSLREASIPVLETARLVLRRPQLEDANAIAALANDRRIAENTRRIPYPYGLEDAEDFIARTGGRDGEMAFLIARNDGTVVGGCGIGLLDGPTPEIGYWLGVPFWGQGYATEAVRALIDYAFTELDHEALQAGARVTNPASRRILEKCGFQWTGVGLVRIRAISSSAPIDQFRLDRGLWNSLRNWGAVKRVA